MDFDGIKDFIDSVGDTVAVFGNEEAIRLYDEIKEIIDDWSSCDSDDIPDTVLTNLMRSALQAEGDRMPYRYYQ